MAIGSDGYEIIRVSLFGPPPLEQIHLSIDAGLITLFGPNGAGKSSVLEGVLDALHGWRRAKARAYVHVRLTGLTLNTDPERVSRFERSLRQGLSIDPTEVYGRTRQRLWGGVLTAISDRAEVELPPVGDSMVVSLSAVGSEDSPQWSVFYSDLLDEEAWSRVDAFASWRTSMMDWARRYKQHGEGHPEALLDEVVMPPVVPFLEDSPMIEDVPMVSPAGKGEHLNFWPRDWPVPQLWLGNLTMGPVDLLTDGVSAGWVREATGRKLIDMASGAKSFINVVDEETEFDQAFEKDVQVIEARANEFFSPMGYPHYHLSVDLKTPKAWFVGETPEWKVTAVHPSKGDETFDLSDLSAAEQRWGVAAVQWALAGAGDDKRPRALLIDADENRCCFFWICHYPKLASRSHEYSRSVTSYGDWADGTHSVAARKALAEGLPPIAPKALAHEQVRA
ncbi:AAA family ATPase [Pseudarthrobacter oxydans]|uniref:AAA family ATPase n=1 Tax=Pseudarthrobacter oxydans TaxID=1671 RepID=UPI00381C46D8